MEKTSGQTYYVLTGCFALCYLRLLLYEPLVIPCGWEDEAGVAVLDKLLWQDNDTDEHGHQFDSSP